MKIIDQSHIILNLPGSICKKIEQAARTCYKSENRIKPGSDIDMVERLMKSGHGAMLEFADITVKFITNRGVSHELVRHRHCSFAQESTRYVKYKGGMEFIKPVWLDSVALGIWDKEGILCLQRDEFWHEIMCFLAPLDLAEKSYKKLIEGAKWKAQQAREVLPNALKTEIVVKANIREWRHIFGLRCDKASHPQMVALMRGLLADLSKRVPVVFDDLASKFLNNGEK